MAELKVFVSSTCYDLSLLRSQLRTFIKSVGYEPVMSDYEDVLYDPRNHTHVSCIDEVTNCDILLLIIGSRFGGKSTTDALDKINFEELQSESSSTEILKKHENLSITQLEVIKAIECSIPTYVFIDKQVWHDHALYEKNKDKDIIDQIEFPSIEKKETAKYIFDFINFVRLRTTGNNIFTFEKGQDIEEILKKQWSAYFQRLLHEQRSRNTERKKLDHLSEQFEDLKTAIISSIQNVDQKETARGVVRYRRLSELLLGLKISDTTLSSSQDSFYNLLKNNKIVDILDIREVDGFPHRSLHWRTLFIKDDGTFFEARIPKDLIIEYENDWESFKKLDIQIKRIILDALQEMGRPLTLVRYRNIHIEDFVAEHHTSTLEKDNQSNS